MAILKGSLVGILTTLSQPATALQKYLLWPQKLGSSCLKLRDTHQEATSTFTRDSNNWISSCCKVTSVVSYSMRPHRRLHTRFRSPWESPGKNTGVGCHFLLQCMKVESESEVVQSCPTLSDPMDCRLPGSSIHGIFQARELEWGASAFSEWVADKWNSG